MGKWLEELRKSSCGKLSVGDTAGTCMAISYDPKVSGETAHRPAIRQPPFRKELYNKRIKMHLSRSSDGTSPEQDAYVMLDGGKDGHNIGRIRPVHGARRRP